MRVRTVVNLEIFMTAIIDDFEHFVENSIAQGFKPHEFSDLDTDVKKAANLFGRLKR